MHKNATYYAKNLENPPAKGPICEAFDDFSPETAISVIEYMRKEGSLECEDRCRKIQATQFSSINAPYRKGEAPGQPDGYNGHPAGKEVQMMGKRSILLIAISTIVVVIYATVAARWHDAEPYPSSATRIELDRTWPDVEPSLLEAEFHKNRYYEGDTLSLSSRP